MTFYAPKLLAFFVLLSVSMEAQQLVPSSKIDPISKKQSWGYADRFFTAHVIAPTYDSTFVFAESYGRFIQNGKYGYLDRKGTIIIPAKFDLANDFSQGLAAVKVGGQAFYIDKKGVDIFKKAFGSAADFSGGLAMVADAAGLFGFINTTGVLVIPCQFKNGRPFSNGLAPVVSAGETTWKAIDTKGKTIFSFGNDVNYARSGFQEGLASVYRRDGPDDASHFDFVNNKGEYICKTPYLDANPFKNGRAIVLKKKEGRVTLDGQVYKFGLIDRFGKEIVPPTYSCLEESAIPGIYFYGAPAGSGYGCSGYGLMDSMGKILTDAKFSSFTHLNDTTFLCKETDRPSKPRFLLLTTKGKELLSTRQFVKEFVIAGVDTLLTLFSDFGSTISMSLYNTRTGVMVDNSTEGIIIYDKPKIVAAFSGDGADGSIMTTAGKLIADKVQMQIVFQNSITTTRSPFLLLKKAAEPGYKLFSINSGNYVAGNYDFGTRPYQYHSRYSAGMLAVTQNGKWGFIDSTGKLRIPLLYEEARDFNDGWAVVQNKSPNGGTKWMTYVNPSGKVMPGIKAAFLNASDFSEGIACFSAYEEVGKNTDLSICYINNTGKIIYRSKGQDFFNHGRFSNGMAAVSNDEGMFGFINQKGELVIPCQYSIPPHVKDEDDEDDTRTSGPNVFDLQFDNYGQVAVLKDGRKIWIDRTGKVIKN